MIHFFKILLFILLPLSFFKLSAQDLWKTLDYQTTNTGDNGLIGQWTMAFLQDYQDRIWIGTESGISIKKGSKWTSINKSEGLLANEVAKLVEGKDRSVWIGYESYLIGVSRYKDGVFTHYNSSNVLIHDKIEDIFRDSKDNIWIASQGGVNRFDGEKWYSYNSENGFASSYPTSISEDTLGNVWFGTKSDGLWVFDGGEFNYHFESGSPRGYVHEVFIDNRNRTWIYTPSGVYMRDRLWSKVAPYDNSFGVVRDINQDLDSTIYIVSSLGVYRVKKDLEVVHYTTEQGIPHNNTLTSSLINGHIFVGTEDGYTYFDGDEWKSNLTSENGLIHNDINHIFKDSKGALWFCTQGGISKYDGSFWESYRKTPEGNEIEWVKSGLQDREGNYWFTTVHGIFRFDGEEWQIHDYNESEIFKGWGQDIIEDRNGNIWIASFNYLLMYDGTNWSHYNDSDGFLNNHIDALYEDVIGNVWIGSRSQISRWGGKGFEHYSPYEIYKNEELAIHAFLEGPNGGIIASTYHGNFIYKDEIWVYFGDTPSLWYFDSFIDKNDVMWFGTISGLGKYDGSTFELFNAIDGLAGDVVQSVYRDELSGDLWIGTSQGITHIVPDIEVTDIEVSGTYLRVESKGISQPFHYSLDGSNFDNDSGELTLDSESEVDLYITNAYDTSIYENLRIHTITKIEISESNYLVVSPNPSEGLYKINQSGFIRILNSKGKIIYEGKNDLSNNVIDIRGRKNGLYILQVIQDNKMKSYKVIKE